MKVERINLNGSLGVVNAARVSYGTESNSLTEKDIKLIKYLQKHNHISPFFHPQASFILNNFNPERYTKEQLQGIEWHNFNYEKRINGLVGKVQSQAVGIRCSMYSLINLFLKKNIIHSKSGYAKWTFDNTWLEQQFNKYEASRLPYLQFKITAPIFVVRQLEKSGFGFARNEKSGRYTKINNEFYKPQKWRKKSLTNKQGSLQNECINEVGIFYLPEQQKAITYDDIVNICDMWYDRNIQDDVAGEMARMALPLSTLTEFVWTGSLQDYARLCSLRLKEDTQKETRELTQMIYDICKKEYPSFDEIIQKRINLSEDFTNVDIDFFEVEKYLD